MRPSAILIYRTLLICFTIAITGCRKDEPIAEPAPGIPSPFSVSGKVQKGPFKNGTSVTVYELNDALGQNGKSFASTIEDDQGTFNFQNIDLATKYILVIANGYYYNEHFNKSSEGTLSLEAIADTSSSSTLNVNILTHIIKPRIEVLVGSGKSFANATAQAQNELLTFLNFPLSNASFHQLNLMNDAAVFAASLIFQRSEMGYTMNFNYTAELSSLLSSFRNDFKDNGLINSPSLIDTLLHNANQVELIDVKRNTEGYYNSLGNALTVPSFEEYIYRFQQKYSSSIVTAIDFPQIAQLENQSGPPSNMTNILYTGNATFQGGPKVIAAAVPFNEELKVRITTFGSADLTLSFPDYGWLTESNGTTVREFTVQRKNYQVGRLVYLNGQDSARIEYFKNQSTSPYITRTIYW